MRLNNELNQKLDFVYDKNTTPFFYLKVVFKNKNKTNI
jgi:hypothetical protein